MFTYFINHICFINIQQKTTVFFSIKNHLKNKWILYTCRIESVYERMFQWSFVNLLKQVLVYNIKIAFATAGIKPQFLYSEDLTFDIGYLLILCWRVILTKKYYSILFNIINKSIITHSMIDHNSWYLTVKNKNRFLLIIVWVNLKKKNTIS